MLSLVIGIVFFGYGICIIVWRRQFNRFSKWMLSTLYGRLGRRVTQRFSPTFIALIGAFFVLFGATGLVFLATGRPLFEV